MRPSGTHLYKRSVGPSVGRSVGRSITPMQIPAVFGHGEILHWNKWSTNMFWECFHPSVCPSVSPYICHMINTRWHTARTHRCPVGLVFFHNRKRIKGYEISERGSQNKQTRRKSRMCLRERRVCAWERERRGIHSLTHWNFVYAIEKKAMKEVTRPCFPFLELEKG